MPEPPLKMVFMGLWESGKSSIKSVVFDGKTPEQVAKYKATIDFERSTKEMIRDSFQIVDCGGQETFISSFVGDKAEFIFSNVNVLVWVVDSTSFENLSLSKFYFDQAIANLSRFSPDACVFVLFHKTDLIIPTVKRQILRDLRELFESLPVVDIHYRGTSIYDRSIFDVFGEILRKFFSSTPVVQSISEAISNFMVETDEIVGISIFTKEGLPFLESGSYTDKILVPANLWLSCADRIGVEFKISNTLKSIIKTDDYFLVFQKIKNHLLLTGIGRATTPLQFVEIKLEKLVETVDALL